MPTIEISPRQDYSAKLDTLISYGSDLVPPGNIWLTIEMDIDDKSLYEEVKLDRMFLKSMQEKSNRVVDDFLKQCVEIIKEAGDAAVKDFKRGNGSYKKALEKEQPKVKSSIERLDKWLLQPELKKIFEKHIEKRQKILKDYKKYKIGVVTKLVITSAALGASIATLATSATPAAPATLGPAVVAMILSVASLTKQIRDLMKDADDQKIVVHKKLIKYQQVINGGNLAEALQKNAVTDEVTFDDQRTSNPKKQGKVVRGLKEFGGVFLKKTFSWTSLGLENVTSIEKANELFNDKINSQKAKLTEMSVDLGKTYQKFDLLKKNIDQLEKSLLKMQDNVSSAELIADAKKDLDELRKNYKKLDEVKKTIEKLEKKCEDGVKEGKEFRKQYKAFKVVIDKLKEAEGVNDAAFVAEMSSVLGQLAVNAGGGAPSNWTGVENICMTSKDIVIQGVDVVFQPAFEKWCS